MAEATEIVASETTSQSAETPEVTATEQQAETVESAPATEATAIETTGEMAGSEPVKPLGDKGKEELITQRKKRQEAERDAAYWKGVAEGRVQPQQAHQVQQIPQGPPVIDNFENYDDYLVAKTKFEVKQEAQQERLVQRRRELDENFNKQVRTFEEKTPDYHDVINNPDFVQSPAMEILIKGSDIGPELAYHLGKNTSESRRIAMLDPVSAAREIGKIEAKLSIPKTTQTNRISQAPEPIKTVGAKGSTPTELEKIPIEDFMKQRNKAQVDGRKWR